MTPLSEWQNFYVIVGSAAAALTGLQFVTMALIAEMPLPAGQVEEGSASFSTPTVVWFATVLMIAAMLTAPWRSVAKPAVLLGLAGLAGLSYIAVLVRRMRVQSAYKPVFEDWLFRILLPTAAYLGLIAAAFATRRSVRDALFAVAAVVLLFLAIGIQNAWDNVTYLVLTHRANAHAKAE